MLDTWINKHVPAQLVNLLPRSRGGMCMKARLTAGLQAQITNFAIQGIGLEGIHPAC